MVDAEVLDQATEGCQLKDCSGKAATAFFVQLALVRPSCLFWGRGCTEWGHACNSIVPPKLTHSLPSGLPQENATNTFAAFSGANEKGFASQEEFEMRVEIFKENLQKLEGLNANSSDMIVSFQLIRVPEAGASGMMYPYMIAGRRK